MSGNKYLNLHVLTWNVAGNTPAIHDIESLFLPQETLGLQDVRNDTDILAVGLQEAYPNVHEAVTASLPLVGRDPLVEDFGTVLGGKGFARLAYCRTVGIVIMIFVKRPLLCYIQHVETCLYRTGMGGLWGNKGATSVRFTLGDLNAVFTNCHLVPHNENNERRTQELHEIITCSNFPDQSVGSNLLDYDVMILFGDLNFRLEGKDHEEVVQTIARGEYKSLLKIDQLLIEQIKGSHSPSYLHNFMEMQLEFIPSYKYEPGTDKFHDGGKGRAPAWTDRVLWYINSSKLPQPNDKNPLLVVKPDLYRMHMQPRTSDHKPVSARLKVLADVGTAPRVMFRLSEWVAGRQGRVELDVAPGTMVSSWDWVGLYHEGFVCVERDPVVWWYTPAVRGKATRMMYYSKPLMGDQVPSLPGRYLLLYKSSHYKSVIGMSPLFMVSSE